MTEIRSMTGYGNAEVSNSRLVIKTEIKSLNGKFFECNLRLPKYFKDKETEIRQWSANVIKRGSVQINIQADWLSQDGLSGGLNINQALAAQYKSQLDKFCQSINLTQSHEAVFNYLIQIPDIIKAEENLANEGDIALLFQSLDQAFQNFDAFRAQEGISLGKELLELNEGIIVHLEEVLILESERKQYVRDKITKSISDIKERVEIDPSRFEYEILYYLEKMDIQEEITRLRNHLNFFNETLQTEATGKKLGFISQEMGREINTMGSKANYYPMQKAVVEMKNILEKIKEQSLNIL